MLHCRLLCLICCCRCCCCNVVLYRKQSKQKCMLVDFNTELIQTEHLPYIQIMPRQTLVHIILKLRRTLSRGSQNGIGVFSDRGRRATNWLGPWKVPSNYGCCWKGMPFAKLPCQNRQYNYQI